MRLSVVTLSLLSCFATGTACAESPTLYEDWVPSGWKLIANATGDLNQDGAEDALLVVEEQNADNLVENDGFGARVMNLNPRRLIVLFNTANGYRKMVSNDSLIPREHDSEIPCLADPLQEGGVAIDRGRILVELGTWLSCGSYGVTHLTFTFRFEDDRLRLIGYDLSEFSRSSGEATAYSVNYLTGRIKTTTGENVFEDGIASVSWSEIPGSGRFYIEGMSPFCYSGDEPGCQWYRW